MIQSSFRRLSSEVVYERCGRAFPQNSVQTQKPKPKIEEMFERAKQACIKRKTAEANGERSQYVAKFPRRILRGTIWGAIRGAAMGGYAGANGGEALEPLGGGVPGAIGGGIVGGIFGAAAGTLTSAAAEPFFRMYHDWRTVNPALNRIAIDCDAEARTATSTAVLRGTP